MMSSLKVLLLRLYGMFLFTCFCPCKAADYDDVIKINLNKSCTAEQLRICTFSGVNASIDKPLIVANEIASELRELTLRNSIIRTVPVDLLRLAPHLRCFIMHNCGLYRLNIEDFESRSNLTMLILQKNRLSKLIAKQFYYLANLEILELGHNIIHTVHQDAFLNLTQLQRLGLQGNGITELMNKAFQPLVNLSYLDLSDNEIDTIDEATFQFNLKLETLLLINNRFRVFQPESLLQLRRLRLLDVSNNALDALHICTADTIQLQSSSLKRLVIKERVIRLHASNNELSYVSVGEPAAVIELDLHGNHFTSVDPLLAGMVNLQHLDLSKNAISQLRNASATANVSQLEMPSLMYLNIAANKLQELTAEDFLLMPRITQLDVSFNHLLRMGADSFEALSNLEKLYIEGNRLHQFSYEKLMQNHPHLKELGLCDNEWDFDFMRKMVTFLNGHGVHLPARYTKHMDPHPKNINDMEQPAVPKAQAQHVGTGSIHPYWTTRDVLAVSTLVIVFAILLLQLFRILQEEGCFQRCRRAAANYGLNGVVGQAQRPRPRRLNEEDSEV